MAKHRGRGKSSGRTRDGRGSESSAGSGGKTARARDDWASWRRAEARLANGASGSGADPVPRELSGELAWYWRAMRALHEGRRDEVEQLAAEASVGNPTVAWLLQTLLADPAKLDPSAQRKAAKRAGVGAGANDPTLDLLRVLACSRAGAPIHRSSLLSKAARQRRALRASLDLMQLRRLRQDSLWHLRRLSPRLELLYVASTLRETGAGDIREFLEGPYADEAIAEAFPIERWPDLDADSGAPDLRSWLAGDDTNLDSTDIHLRFHDEIAELCRGPEQERRPVLGALLTRGHRLLQGPRPILALPVVRAAAQLAESMPELDGLAEQLAHLEARLAWFDAKTSVSPRLIEELWRHLQSSPLAERAVVARHICGQLEAFEPEIAAEAACICIVASSSEEDRRRNTGLFGETVATSALEATLKQKHDLCGWERLVVMGQHHRACGRAVAAAETARELVEDPEAGGEGARLLAELVLQAAGQSGLVPGGRQLQASLKQRAGRSALLAALSALSRSRAPQRLAPLLPALPALLASRKTAAALPELRPAVEAVLAGEQAASRTASIEWPLAYLAIGDGERADRAFRDFGRQLRPAAGAGRPGPAPSPPRGDGTERTALRAAARLSEVAALRLPRPVRGVLESWLGSITAFLCRRGSEALSGLLESHRIREPEEVAGIAHWCVANREKLDDESCWHGLLAQGLALAAEQNPSCVPAYAQRHLIPFVRQMSEEDFEEVFAGLAGFLMPMLPPELRSG